MKEQQMGPRNVRTDLLSEEPQRNLSGKGEHESKNKGSEPETEEKQQLSHSNIRPVLWYLRVIAHGHTAAAGVQRIFKSSTSEPVHTGQSEANAANHGL